MVAASPAPHIGVAMPPLASVLFFESLNSLSHDDRQRQWQLMGPALAVADFHRLHPVNLRLMYETSFPSPRELHNSEPHFSLTIHGTFDRVERQHNNGEEEWLDAL